MSLCTCSPGLATLPTHVTSQHRGKYCDSSLPWDKQLDRKSGYFGNSDVSLTCLAGTGCPGSEYVRWSLIMTLYSDTESSNTQQNKVIRYSSAAPLYQFPPLSLSDSGWVMLLVFPIREHQTLISISGPGPGSRSFGFIVFIVTGDAASVNRDLIKDTKRDNERPGQLHWLQIALLKFRSEFSSLQVAGLTW